MEPASSEKVRVPELPGCGASVGTVAAASVGEEPITVPDVVPP
jgi:hypothetical protein